MKIMRISEDIFWIVLLLFVPWILFEKFFLSFCEERIKKIKEI